MLSKRLFRLMLLAYPREFRLEYGSEMTQLFRDCHRDVQSGGLVAFWLRMIIDVMRTAPLERWETLGKGETMKNLKSDAIGLLACVAIIVAAFLLLGYGRKHEVAPIMLFGALDAIIAAGVISNLIIFPLVMATRLSRFRIALLSLLIVHAALLLICALIGTSDPHFNFPWVLTGYVVSFVFWLTIHWLWLQRKSTTEPVA
jgi:hypothetical protein